jgi:(3R)-3-hydroxyacyl-CoA dehydrogenase / 3a,7a,12a-trihydroxy-5b-cholest-24-enoyl-CoA hydratase / enoyl-CoA hydratase 2
VYRVHLLGTFRTTLAAWRYMRDARYGRVVLTGSAAGLYGNFGQANYSAMKMSMVGLANTLALEGGKYGICVNVVCPIAGSRMTETVMPEEMVTSLSPEYVAPVVGFLCHESCEDTATVLECGGGWAGKLRRQRSRGVFFPDAQRGEMEMEQVAEAWKAVGSFDEAEYPRTNQDAFGVIMTHLDAAESARKSKL